MPRTLSRRAPEHGKPPSTIWQESGLTLNNPGKTTAASGKISRLTLMKRVWQRCVRSSLVSAKFTKPTSAASDAAQRVELLDEAGYGVLRSGPVPRCRRMRQPLLIQLGLLACWFSLASASCPSPFGLCTRCVHLAVPGEDDIDSRCARKALAPKGQGRRSFAISGTTVSAGRRLSKKEATNMSMSSCREPQSLMQQGGESPQHNRIAADHARQGHATATKHHQNTKSDQDHSRQRTPAEAEKRCEKLRKEPLRA